MVVSSTALLVLLCISCCCASLVPTSLQCNNQVEPVGVGGDVTLSWRFQSATSTAHQRNVLMSAYQVVVEAKDGAIMWNSGRGSSNNNHHIKYKGKELVSHKQYYWKVRVWDHTNIVSAWSAPASFSTSILKGQWTAGWISSNTGSNETGNYFRKEFTTSQGKKVWQSFVTVAGLGLYELYLNGQRVGRDEISNGFTNYNKTVFTATYDVTSIVAGPNTSFCLGAILGNGMYNVVNSRPGRYTKFIKSFGERMLTLQLTVEYTDGTALIVTSDSTWNATQGPIIFAHIYGGEDYNATLEEDGWNMPNFNSDKWVSATITNGPTGALVPIYIPTVKVQEALATQNITKLTSSSYIYDLGQNFAGWPHITVKGVPGAEIRLTPAELLVNGSIDQSMSGSPYYLTYVLRGGMLEEWHPRFTYYGFRWVQVNITGQAEIISLEGHFIYADLDVVGNFVSSNALFNRIHEIILNSYKSNLQSIFHDCPHREKLGWLEQSHLLASSVAYNFDMSQLFSKIVRDMYEAQINDRAIPEIAPQYDIFSSDVYNDAPEWGSSYILVSWFLYERYGNVDAISQYFPNLLGYLYHLSDQATGNIVSYGLGDWADIVFFPKINDAAFPKNTFVNLTSTCVYYEDIVALNASATVLGYTQYVQQLTSLATSVRNSFNQAFFNNNTLTYSTGSQTSNSYPLILGISDPANTQTLINAIIKDVRAQNNHTTCGEIGHVYFLRALAENGRSDVINDIHTRTDLAGYGYMLTQGATALSESWDFNPDASHNHAMFGHIEEWFYEYLAGIKYSHNKIVIQPTPLSGLTYVNGSYNSIHGLITTSWHTHANDFHLFVSIPSNAHAKVVIPAVGGLAWESGVEVAELEEQGVMKMLERSESKCTVQVGSGYYAFTSKLL